MEFTFRNGKISGLKIVNPFFVKDERGYFLKNMEKDILAQFGIHMDIQEEIVTYSQRNVIRGMHFQTHSPQGKLVSVLRGEILDVAIDLRKNSSTFGQWEKVVLSDDTHEAFWIPPGFAHGFQVLSEDALVCYQCVGRFFPEYDTGIRWDDTDLGIPWKECEFILSEKDRNLMSFRFFAQKYGGLNLGDGHEIN